MRIAQWFIGLSLGAFVLAACSSNSGRTSAILQDPWGTIRIQPDESIRIAVVSPSGSDLLPSEAQEVVRGVTLAAERRGLVRGYTVELVDFDSGCNAADAADAASAIADDPKIVGAVGFYCSDACQAAGPILDAAHVMLLSPGCSASALTDEVTHSDAFLRTMYPDSREGMTAAQFAYNELGARRAYVVSDGSLSADGLIQAFETEFLDLGGVIIREARVAGNQIHFGEALINVQQTRPDVIYAPLLTRTSARFVGDLHTTSLEQIPYIGGRFSWTTLFIQEADVGDATNVYTAGPLPPQETYSDLTDAYVQQFSSSPTSATFAFAYDAMNLLFRGIENSSEVDHQSLVIGRQALRNALYKTAGYSAATGPLTCTEWGDCSAGGVAVAQLRGSQWQVVYVP